MDLTKFIDGQKQLILDTYQDLHKLAEPSWEEEKTANYLKEKLLHAGFNIQTYEGHFGFIAEMKGIKKDVIAIRADMDALVQEVDGVVKPNHSCGHDAHSTMVLFTALALSKKKFTHTIRFIFQPAEEKAAGALKMMEEGALQDVKFLAGIHLRPAMEVSFGKAAPAILHGSTASIKGVIKGVPAHAARPEEGNNPLEAAAFLIQAIRQIRLNASDHFSIKITELNGGEASNSIPGTARFTLDLRAKSNETMEKLLKNAEHTIRKVAELTETMIEFNTDEYSPAAIRNLRAIELAEYAVEAVLGKENLEPACVSPGAEDFHFYTLKNPGLTATMIGLGCDLTPGLHHPNMKFNQDALMYGTKILSKMLVEADGQQW
ncbi:amidohydrolase [Bacillus pakistanensis]|uniref:Amidohydrolase n=1 Tax=Rossellomorea pakistanensis TaxID=992288 RepID=A0ABS2NH30_9BACI|nr:amidohydrolase [Bacillus pakistanensis]MBM7587175.1 amidohydrolase [Bacillus pakistanensis]